MRQIQERYESQQAWQANNIGSGVHVTREYRLEVLLLVHPEEQLSVKRENRKVFGALR